MKPENDTVKGYETAIAVFDETESKSRDILNPHTICGAKTPIDWI